jgi:hypothetical protein
MTYQIEAAREILAGIYEGIGDRHIGRALQARIDELEGQIAAYDGPSCHCGAAHHGGDCMCFEN